MNPLPRLLATGLFVVLAALAALLVAPAWQAWRQNLPNAAAHTYSPGEAARNPGTPPSASSSQLVQLSSRLGVGLALVGTALAAALMVSLTLRPGRRHDSRAPFEATRTEVGALSKLAETSAAQREELTRERDVRRRAEEDLQLKQRLLAQSLEEKIRLGRDLHDGIIQSLYAVGLTLESVRGLLRADPAEADRRLEHCRTALNTSIRDARSYITGLAPENLRRSGFAHALGPLLDELRADRAVRFEMKIDDDATALLTADQTLEALQIAREAVSNALRHGDARVITVRVHQGEREVCLLVQDSGCGFDAAGGPAHGRGLGNMQARAAHLGAKLHIASRPGEGTRVVVNIPIFQPAAV
jgi:signal transduction histidine kinase